MLSDKTILDLVRFTDTFDHPEINRLMALFNISRFHPDKKTTVMAKGTDIYFHFKHNKNGGPFSNDTHLDFLEYLIDYYFRKIRPDYISNNTKEYTPDGGITFKNAFIANHKEIGNSLKRDGYTVEGKTIKKLLPEEIAEAKTESDLIISLDKYGFSISKGHLTQGIANHSQGNWASANSQFRTFIESLLTEISNFLLPNNPVKTAAQAIKTLAETATPPFLSKDLNEFPSDKDSDSFVYGLWIRLHPNGSHPGLSDEDDCSFRYHISIVFANYLLRRLTDRNKVSA